MTWNRAGFWALHLFVLAYCGVLLGGFIVQFGGHEYPCPLCVLQRMAMILTALGPAYIIVRAKAGPVSLRDYTTGLGMAMAGALAGAAMSTRQVLLHIVPGDPGYGEAVMGLHLYTWALVTFIVVLVYCAFALIFAKELVPAGVRFGWPSRAVLWLFTALIAANMIVVFFEEGFHWVLPDDPVRYQLCYDLGLCD
ncbi:disulfide bond formation protein B [Longispora albida]|uniref:disulfide bond formation protein B n=1 Tax=Longispora albida TaxID=203523 RepID=UPI00037891EB|nr:disulfide bond formation protein B [Longispora albida]